MPLFRCLAVLAACLLPAAAFADSRVIAFSGYQWTVKSSGTGTVGPGPNYFSDSTSNVWVDSSGKLHLKITQDANGNWQCAEIYLNQSLGYGSYQFEIGSDVGDLDPVVVLGLFTYATSPLYNHREIDVEVSRWSVASDPNNVQYTVQPPRTGNYYEWPLATGYTTSTHAFTWSASAASFKSTAGQTVLAQWTENRKATIPPAGGEVIHLNLWLNQGQPPQRGMPTEVVISGFKYAP